MELKIVSSSKSFYLLMAVHVALLCFAFSSVFPGLWLLWQSDEYSYAPLIPFLSLLIAWHRLTDAPPVCRPSMSGAAVVFCGFCLLILSKFSAFEPPSDYGFVCTLTGLLLGYFGKAFTKTVTPALIYLLFAIPLPRLLFVGLSAKMQLLSSTLGVNVLDFLNIPVFQEGNVIDLGGYKLQVAEACNGLRYLFPLTSFSFLIALLLNDRIWKRIVIFLSAVPITIGLNALRIAFIGITVDHWGTEMAEGLVHEFEGWVVFILCLGVLFLETSFLQNLPWGNKLKGRIRFEYFTVSYKRPIAGHATLTKAAWASLLITVGFTVILSSGLIDNRQEIIPHHLPFLSFPEAVGDWQGVGAKIDDEVLATLKPDDYLSFTFSENTSDAKVGLYMAYYESQRIGASIHSPENCIPGNGWAISNTRTQTLETSTASFPVTRMIIEKGSDRAVLYYWFEERGRILTDQYQSKWYLMIDSFNMHRTDGALIRLTTTLSPQESENSADSRLQSFLNAAYPEIKKHLP